MTTEELKAIKDFTRSVEWLKAQSIKPKPESWISYAEAYKILPRSKQWYQYRRMGYADCMFQFIPPILVRGVDWRRVGGLIEYRAESIVNLKNSLVRAA